VLESVRAVAALGMEVCCTLGMLTDPTVQLKEAGVTAYNHNLDSGRSFTATSSDADLSGPLEHHAAVRKPASRLLWRDPGHGLKPIKTASACCISGHAGPSSGERAGEYARPRGRHAGCGATRS